MSGRPRIRRALAGAAWLAALAAAGGALAAPGATVRAKDVFGRRYCELLLVHRAGSGLVADVYNTYGLNDCPPRTWQAIDTGQVASANHVIAVARNGPRFWLMNEIDKVRSGAEVIKDLGGLRMIEEATLSLASLDPAPYVVHSVNRATTFIFQAGTTVYELAEPGGKRWVMQSYSEQADPSLGLHDLAGLGPRLHLPHGWSYRVVRLRQTLSVVTVRTDAQVIQDSLDNTYSRFR